MVALPSSRWSRIEPAEQACRENWLIVLVDPDPSDQVHDVLDELALTTPPARTLAVVAADAAPRAVTALEGHADHVFYQPAVRGSGFAAYVALAMIRRWNPWAVVAIATSDSRITSEDLRALHAAAARAPAKVFVVDGVVVGTVDALWETGRSGEPGFVDILDSLVPLVGTRDEDEAIEYIYNAYLPVNLARDMLRVRHN